MVRLGMLYVASYVFTVLTIADSAYYLTLASSSPSPSSPPSSNIKSSILPGASTSVLVAMSFRITFSILYLVGGLFLDRRPRVLLPLTGAVTVATFGLLVACSALLRFHLFVPSLYLHVLTLFLFSMAFLDQLMEAYGLRSAAEEAADSASGAANNNQGALQMKKKKKKAVNKSSETTGVRLLRLLDANMMAIGTLAAVAVAIIVGVLIRANDPTWSARQLMYAGYAGELFLRMLKCLILPLIFSSLVFAIGNIDASLSGRIALRAVSYYFATTFIAIIIGILLVTGIQPGKRGQIEGVIAEHVTAKKITTMDTILDLIR